MSANSSLQLELAEMAKGVKQLLDGRREDSISVGAFTGPSHLASSSGSVITKTLAEELVKLGIRVKNHGTNLEIKGDYLDVVDRQSDRLAARLKARVLDRQGTVIIEFERGLFGTRDLASLFGLTGHLPPQADDKTRDQFLRKSIDKPSVHVAGTRISSAPGSTYAIEILVAPGPRAGQYQPRAAHIEDGLAFVSIQRGEVYLVRLINNADHQAAVTLTIDGLNMYDFSEVRDPRTHRPKFSLVLVDPHTAVPIRGWHRTMEESEEFVVTDYAKSAAAELKSTSGIGTITAVFVASWPKGSPPPAGEPPNPAEHSRHYSIATGRGSRVHEKFIEVEQPNFGVVRDTISVRYTK